jgi:AcrR family transcriptional regulator
MTETATRPQRGRYAEAERNDTAILEAARSIFVADPNAPISAVAKRAGVGIGALYNRYGSKENLLGTLCRIGQDVYLEEVARALESTEDPGKAYIEFLRRMVAADTHSLTVSLAGTFTPNEQHLEKAERMRKDGEALFDRAQKAKKLRPDVTYLDVAYLLEAIATTNVGDPERTAEVRQRQLAVIIDGLRAHGGEELPGSPPTWQEQMARWAR